MLSQCSMSKHYSMVFMFWNECMQAWMCRYSRSEDVITGLATDEPGSAELQQLIGMDCNPVALRTSFAGEQKSPLFWAMHPVH